MLPAMMCMVPREGELLVAVMYLSDMPSQEKGRLLKSVYGG